MISSNSDNPNDLSLDCGISLTRIQQWLDNELSLPREPSSDRNAIAWRYADAKGTCRIEASPLDDGRIGPLRLERTLLVAQGEAEAIASFQHRFTLRFMSAGG